MKSGRGEGYDDHKWGSVSPDEIDEYCEDRDDTEGVFGPDYEE